MNLNPCTNYRINDLFLERMIPFFHLRNCEMFSEMLQTYIGSNNDSTNIFQSKAVCQIGKWVTFFWQYFFVIGCAKKILVHFYELFRIFSAIISECAYDSRSLQYSSIRSVSFQIFKAHHCEDMHVSTFLRRFKVADVTYHLLLEDLQDVHYEEAGKMSTFYFQRYILKWWHIYFKAWKISTFVKYCKS